MPGEAAQLTRRVEELQNEVATRRQEYYSGVEDVLLQRSGLQGRFGEAYLQLFSVGNSMKVACE